MLLEIPSGSVPLDSPFYIPWMSIEEQIKQEINKPGSLIRIKSPKRTGKTSLLVRILDAVKSQGYQSVSLNLEQVDSTILGDLNRLLRWLCISITRQLGLKNLINDYWDEDIGSKVSCTIYFEDYLLKNINVPLILALDEVNYIFNHPNVAKDFFPLLRSWYEEAKRNVIWRKLRFIIVYSTEIYIPLQLNQSPFNIGLPIKLPEFDISQIQELAKRHNLNWTTEKQAIQLMEMIGGHPYLVRLALYYLAQGELTLTQLIQNALTSGGIYSDHLREHLITLQKDPSLGVAFKKIIAQENFVLEPTLAYKLDSMGLVKFVDQQWQPLCNLYRFYFLQQNLEQEDIFEPRLIKLTQENKRLRKLVYLDELTGIYNRRYFDHYLEREWRRMTREKAPLSLMLLDIDYFKNYNDTYGHQLGDACLKKVAQAIQKSLKRSTDIVARYGGEEFAIIISQCDNKGALFLAEIIREQIKSLAINHKNSQVNLKIVTASIGVATIIPALETQPKMLIQMADEALYQSKHEGRNRVTFRNNQPLILFEKCTNSHEERL
ncbi:diguanylate cyclase [Gloeothece citriformis PCC 7424]|uniref:Diguanylate cyclase n=1 Tax=Gloeothece citriformis (strain PCC 7424) TaxID=65393 RepID=B7KB78_GLOC7|nr:AAA-like domain-containing protein [Gloeothece citriformis]ACK71434.1 diguanylate cyclase [Gloeothece citriformis PCC 7424]